MPALESVLLVGGSGFLGLHLIEQYWNLTPRPDIYVFDIRPLPEKISTQFTFDPTKITCYQGDLTSAKDVEHAIKSSGVRVLVHSASPMHGNSQEIYEMVNVEGTKNLLDVAKKCGITAFIYTSSAGVIFNGQDIHNADETWPIPDIPMDGYNETKAIAEKMVLTANDPQNGFLTIALRPAGIFGPGDRQLVPGLRQVAKLGQSKYQLGNNNNLFDWTYAGNVADAHVLAAKKLLDPANASSVSGETFFITNDAPTYFWALARAVWKADGHIDDKVVVLNRPVALVVGYLSQFFTNLLGKESGLTPFRVRVVCATRYHNISKAKKLLGYKPCVDLEEGIKRTLLWMDEDAS
ncbi:AFR001Wp [Eremothecium gossypii ATCC 10895]|uniref:Sterol-4-alpha-carboxylate 3-dehydrogenase ERG26, decarboxylating n=1 Tax=Eremothecium gossypii (strain ATCC 10895 / CBS 109.51 / FGSC 9923 / NRRL Y-1056) TaxID=284811 RepID=Q754S1_EREGS|nr:AFR001Wp [Eremothecium gossypii ATCC 10895]AAS53372.1 AFR001Wp [Eremothecium gossypii ATCC 10895]AEY97683.1 FAFR001Wp [Eremothecium gossypii FDAG1]